MVPGAPVAETVGRPSSQVLPPSLPPTHSSADALDATDREGEARPQAEVSHLPPAQSSGTVQRHPALSLGDGNGRPTDEEQMEEGTRAQTEDTEVRDRPRILTGGFVLPRPLSGDGNGDARGKGNGETGEGDGAGTAADPEDPIEPEEEELVNKDCPICFFEMSTGRKRPVFCSGSPSCGKCICNECFSEIVRRARPPRRPALCPFCRRALSTERRYNDELMRALTASRLSMRQFTLPEHPSVSFVRMPTRVREQAIRFGAPTGRTNTDPRLAQGGTDQEEYGRSNSSRRRRSNSFLLALFLVVIGIILLSLNSSGRL
uniref:RING-type domain-containing protein n=1 Tax=Chromera velia CCMP2878 TaxID=1169474 RepID=A0A0G4G9L4_9ALVE|eukprot:Cvel_20917.t1-p1 / transcript=Cvel_20917.t1 / gene=Cvel_20917 / organism=Chromera_velia_CCMP2878 / gene_product=hypothetical protein / transcript_product=hypothetical protein / location=Cvel_scaffold1919:13678-19254(+) / protein_length=317 / sequence_SO=supercontig / SO=protein_coding / is_pseudo=false